MEAKESLETKVEAKQQKPEIPENKKAENRQRLMAMLGGTTDAEEFLTARIVDLEEFMAGIRKEEDGTLYYTAGDREVRVISVLDIARYIYMKRRGEILIEDFTKIILKYSDVFKVYTSLPEIERLYNAGKLALCYEKLGFPELEWVAFSRLYSNVFDNRKFPKPPEDYSKGRHSVHEMLLCLKRTELNSLYRLTIKLIRRTIKAGIPLEESTLYKAINPPNS